MQDFSDLKRCWEEAWKALKRARKLPPSLTPLGEKPDKAKEIEKQRGPWLDEVHEARERERQLRRALLRQGPEGKQYVRKRIYSDLQEQCRLEEATLEYLEKHTVPNVARILVEEEGKSEEEARFEARQLALEPSYEKLERLKQEMREIEDP